MIKTRFHYEYIPENTVIMGILFIIAATIAIIINSFVLYLVYRMKKNWSVLSHQIIASVACVDIILSISVLIMITMRLNISYPELFESQIFCPVFGFTLNCFTGISMVLVTTLAFERFLLICYHRSLRSIVAWSIILSISLLYSIAGIGTSMDNAFSPDPTYTYCWPNGTDWSLVLNSVLTATFLGSLSVLTFCYFAIFVACYRWNHPSSRISLDLKSTPSQVPRCGATRAMAFIIAYSLCFLPKFISTLWQAIYGPSTHPFVLFIIAPFCISLSTAINPLMVIFLHTQFKLEALNVLRTKISPSSEIVSQTLEI